MRTHVSNMIKQVEKLRGKYDTWNIFNDFVTMSAISIRNSIKHPRFDEMEEKYMAIATKYNEKELDMFSQMLSELILGLEKEQADILGILFMELNVSNKWQGQFFTPMSISNLCGAMTVEGTGKAIKEDGYITLDEPACGGGAMIIGFANAMRDKGYNYQNQLVVNARDLDVKSVYMCYIQLSLLGIAANIQHGNTITLDIFDEWKTPFFILNRWDRRLIRDREKQKYKVDFNEDETGQLIIA